MVVAMMAAMTALAGLGLVAAHLLLAAHSVQASVDRAALAASDVLWGYNAEQPCSVASEILGHSGFHLVSCELTSRGARVVGSTSVGGLEITRRAHAGIANSGQK